MLINDFAQLYIPPLLNEMDLQHLFKDASIPLPRTDGRVENYIMYTLDQDDAAKPNGIIRASVTPVVPVLSTQASPPRNASPAVNGNMHDAVNGATSSGDQDVKMANITIYASPPSQTDDMHQTDDGNQTMPISLPMRPKAQTPTTTPITNGLNIPSVNNFNSHIATPYVHPGIQSNGLNMHIVKYVFRRSRPMGLSHSWLTPLSSSTSVFALVIMSHYAERPT
ncbi:hypothetical protein NM688_g4269 [Phlebia brevispora]|uniref:Uncharacterized protein n=1 Tax=Phlebia brevispora TaxID=194682 RepID=A0ACC1T3M7_9APHY|nr:hypothetical protein NM688_g4269 [Phlebia brevispora]